MKKYFSNTYQSGFAPLLVLLALLVAAALGVGAYIVHKQSGNPTSGTYTPEPMVSSAAATQWKTYVNEKYGYSIQYPADWTYREFPDTKTGAGFRLENASSTPANDMIVIDAWQRPGMFTHTPFDAFVKQAGMQYIQNYQTLASSEKVTTDSGASGYNTTWHVVSLGRGTTIISLPIAFFHKPGDDATDYVARLESGAYADVYAAMLKTFTFVNQMSSSPVVVGGDRDSHGCIGSAGYSWCQAKLQCIRSWEQHCTAATPKTVMFTCDAGKTVKATFYPTDDTFVDLQLSDGRNMSVPHALSASGARYAKPDESFVFWNKGDTAFITEGADSVQTYSNCVLKTN